MKPKRDSDAELRQALHSLLIDIEDMYEGDLHSAVDQREEFFGPFSVGKLCGVEIGDLSVSWPNLAISTRKARKALRAVEEESRRGSPNRRTRDSSRRED